MRTNAQRRWQLAIVAVVSIALSIVSPMSVSAENPTASPLVDVGLELHVKPWVQIPDASNGRPRINVMTTVGDRVFVGEEVDGRIYEIVETDGQPSPQLFFDVASAIQLSTGRTLDTTTPAHSGLRGVAFHPDFATNGLFYTSHLESRPASPNPSDYLSDVVDPVVADGVLVEWRVAPQTGTPLPDSYRQVFRVGMSTYDHPIKQIAFNPFAALADPDYGLLYIGHGDGSQQSATTGGGQNSDALGKILRIDPTRSGADMYQLPADNPFLDDPSMLDEVFAIGFRNPHRLAFAKDDDGAVHLIVSDAGRDNVEEVDLVVAGGNYGWSDREGTFVHLSGGGLITGIAPLPENEADNRYVYPAADFRHVGDPGDGFVGQAIAGGYAVDNGSELSGNYFFTDFPRSGRILHSTVADLVNAVTTLDRDDPLRDHPDELTQAAVGEAAIWFDHDQDPATAPLPRASLLDVIDDSPRFDGSGRPDTRFGQGPTGELYITSKRNGWVYLVTNSLPPRCQGRAVTVLGTIGTNGNDVINGTDGRDRINGLGGNDVICGLAGSDIINGGPGRDRIAGGRGRDVIGGGDNRDVVKGGAGDDLIDGGRGRDRIAGNQGDDELHGKGGPDTLLGGAGDDRLFGGAGDDVLNGGAGFDIARGGAALDRCSFVYMANGCEAE